MPADIGIQIVVWHVSARNSELRNTDRVRLRILSPRAAIPAKDIVSPIARKIVFLSRINAESGDFTIRDVARDVTEKMVRRHPHVFADSTAGTPAEVLRQWEEIKRREKGADAAEPSSALDGTPRSLPALRERLAARGEGSSRAEFKRKASSEAT